MDPVFEEMQRVRSPQDLRGDVLRRWQSYVREVIQPQLDELAAYKAGELPLLSGRPKREARA